MNAVEMMEFYEVRMAWTDGLFKDEKSDYHF